MIIVLFMHIGKPISAQTNSLLCWPQIQPSISTSEGLASRFKIAGGILLEVLHLPDRKTKSWWKKRGFANLADQTSNLQIKTWNSNKRRRGEFCRGSRGTLRWERLQKPVISLNKSCRGPWETFEQIEIYKNTKIKNPDTRIFLGKKVWKSFGCQHTAYMIAAL